MTQRGAKRGPGKTREMVFRWYERGLEPTQIGKKVGITRQAVWQHLWKLQEQGRIER